jgi:hypothetical protein
MLAYLYSGGEWIPRKTGRRSGHPCDMLKTEIIDLEDCQTLGRTGNPSLLGWIGAGT